MDSLARLLGSSTRSSVVRALALSTGPLTAYMIAKEFNLNVAKVYRETRSLAEMGFLKAQRGRRGLAYTLAQDDLKRLALKLSPGYSTMEDWKSEEASRFRFRGGLMNSPLRARAAGPGSAMPERPAGELETLARLGRKGFDSRFGRKVKAPGQLV